ncbi:MAG: serine/threonine-protein kinase [Pirellulaceae bacterium]|nr:serine/threonine-protein kinase [Pirellulaceae bacterium]
MSERSKANEQKITELLEHILGTNCDPAVACAKCPELLPELSERLKKVRQVEQQLNELFPNIAEQSFTNLAKRNLPKIEGYDIECLLGSGGMGVVYKARHQKLNRIVALKMLRAGQLASEVELSRFTREFQAIAELHCAHIVQIHDVGESDGRPFFTMEYVEGGSLAERLNGTPQPANQAAEMVATLAEAIHSAHTRGIIHRDLKPANILVSTEGLLKIADFGLARHIQCDHPLTVSGAKLGTPSYMAPEQALGTSDSIGPSVDVYSLGAILYEMLTGRPPFRAESAIETQRQVVSVDPVPPKRINASVPRDLETICLTCLDKLPLRRYATAGELAEELKRFLRHEPILARPVSRVERVQRWIRRNPAMTGLVVSGMTMTCLAITLAIREYEAMKQSSADYQKWEQRLEFVNRLELEGRFLEARAILGRVPDGGSSALRKQIERAQTELNLAEELDAIRMSRGKFVQGGGIDYDESHRKYETTFRKAGIGEVGEDPEQVSERVIASSVYIALVAALDDWAACAQAETRRWILDVARRADPNPWRDRVRNQANWANLEELNQLSVEVDIGDQPVTLLVAMGTRWRRLGGDPREFLKRVHREHPNDFWLNFELGVLFDASDSATTAGYNRVALALRPDAAPVHFNLGIDLAKLGQIEDAIFHFRRTIQFDPQHSWAEYQLAICLSNSGKQSEAVEHLQNLLKYYPDFRDARNALRIALVKLGRLKDAHTVWQSVLQNPSVSHAEIDGFAELCLHLGREREYDQTCKLLMERFQFEVDPQICERIGRACLLKPTSESVALTASKFIDRALVSELPEDRRWARPYLLFAKALSEYRLGRYDDSVVLLRGESGTILQPAPQILLAMALRKRGEKEEPQSLLAESVAILSQSDDPNTREHWMMIALCREAQALVALDENPE